MDLDYHLDSSQPKKEQDLIHGVSIVDEGKKAVIQNLCSSDSAP